MAQRVVTHILDDIDGSEDAKEVRFALDGVEYAIDLSADHRKALEVMLQPYLDSGRRITGPRGRKRRNSTSGR